MPHIRYAFRSLRKTPLVTLVVVASLALGIGANTAIFSLLDQVILRSLPVEKPEELVLLSTPRAFKSGNMSTDDSGGDDGKVSARPGLLLPGFDRSEVNIANTVGRL